MSALLPVIKSHRAMAAALQRQAEKSRELKEPFAAMLERLCWSHQSAADDLEEHMRESCDKYGNVENFGPTRTYDA